MSFFSKLWGSVKDGVGGGFAYTPGDVVASYEGVSHWTMRQATPKKGALSKTPHATGPSGAAVAPGQATADSPVTVFEFDSKKSASGMESLARNALKRTKTLRHPSILSYVDSAEAQGQLLLVTEQVVPLRDEIEELRARPEAVSWGLRQIVSALAFLADCKVVHGNVCSASVFVTRSGDWKLWGLDYVSEAESVSSSSPIAQSASSPSAAERPPECNGHGWVDRVDKSALWAVDAYMFGKFVERLFSDLGAQIPGSLRDSVGRMTAPDPHIRLSLKHLLDSDYFSNPYVDALLFLDTITIKDSAEKETFFSKRLPGIVDQLPTNVALFKVLPHLVATIEFGYSESSVTKIVPPILRIGKNLPTSEFNARITPLLVKWYAANDRSMRQCLIENLDNYLEKITQLTLSDQIFPSLATGFVDASPVIRDLTVRSMLLVVPKLPDRLISIDVLRAFAKLQLDPEPSIRANTTVCIGKITKYIPESTRTKVLVPALTRALKDASAPARTAGVVALVINQEYFADEEAAKTVLPALAPLLVDAEKNVRDEAMRCFKAMLEKAARAAQAMDANQPPPQQSPMQQIQQPQQQSQTAAAAGAAWAMVQNIGKKIGDSVDSAVAQPKPGQQQPQQQSQQTQQQPQAAPANSQAAYTAPTISPAPRAAAPMKLAPPPSAPAPVAQKPAAAAADDSWANFEEGWGDTPIFGSSNPAPASAPAPVQKSAQPMSMSMPPMQSQMPAMQPTSRTPVQLQQPTQMPAMQPPVRQPPQQVPAMQPQQTSSAPMDDFFAAMKAPAAPARPALVPEQSIGISMKPATKATPAAPPAAAAQMPQSPKADSWGWDDEDDAMETKLMMAKGKGKIGHH